MREERFTRIGLTRAREGPDSVHRCRDLAEEEAFEALFDHLVKVSVFF